MRAGFGPLDPPAIPLEVERKMNVIKLIAGFVMAGLVGACASGQWVPPAGMDDEQARITAYECQRDGRNMIAMDTANLLVAIEQTRDCLQAHGFTKTTAPAGALSMPDRSDTLKVGIWSTLDALRAQQPRHDPAEAAMYARPVIEQYVTSFEQQCIKTHTVPPSGMSCQDTASAIRRRLPDVINEWVVARSK
jgi:hypothetical protein